MIYSGEETTITRAKDVLSAIGSVVESVYRVSGRSGAASTVKLIDQLLAGIHVAAASEALAFSAHLGLDPTQIFELLSSAAAWSWIFQTRAPQMIEADWGSTPALFTITRDMGMALDEAKKLMFWAPLTSAAHNLYLSATTKGWAADSDAGLVRLYETANVSVVKSASKSE